MIRRTEDLLALGAEPLPAPGVRLGEHLLAAGVVTAKGLREALSLQPRLPGRRLGWILMMLEQLRREDLDRVLAARMGVPTVSISGFRPSIDCAQHLPPGKARRIGMALLHVEEGTSWAAAPDALDARVREMATFALGQRVVLLRTGRHGGHVAAPDADGYPRRVARLGVVTRESPCQSRFRS